MLVKSFNLEVKIMAFDTRELFARLIQCEAGGEGEDGICALNYHYYYHKLGYFNNFKICYTENG